MADTTTPNPPTNGSNPILDLDSLVEGSFIRIDGAAYPLLTFPRMPPLDSHRYVRYSKRAAVLTEKDELTQDEETELGAIPDRMCRLVLPAPDDVHAKLTDLHRMAILDAFMAPPRTSPAPERTSQTPDHSTGESNSLASSASTA